jgi:hypothetical protein
LKWQVRYYLKKKKNGWNSSLAETSSIEIGTSEIINDKKEKNWLLKWQVRYYLKKKLKKLSGTPHLRAFSPESKLSDHHRGSLTWMSSAVANLAVGCCGGVVVWVWASLTSSFGV